MLSRDAARETPRDFPYLSLPRTMLARMSGLEAISIRSREIYDNRDNPCLSSAYGDPAGITRHSQGSHHPLHLPAVTN